MIAWPKAALIILIIVLLIFPSVAIADLFKSVKDENLFIQSTAVFMMLSDWKQTKAFIDPKYNGKYIETNPILGRYPSQQRVDTLCAVAIILEVFLFYSLPEKYRTYFSVSILQSSLIAIDTNSEFGFAVKFKL